MLRRGRGRGRGEKIKKMNRKDEKRGMRMGMGTEKRMKKEWIDDVINK